MVEGGDDGCWFMDDGLCLKMALGPLNDICMCMMYELPFKMEYDWIMDDGRKCCITHRG